MKRSPDSVEADEVRRARYGRFPKGRAVTGFGERAPAQNAGDARTEPDETPRPDVLSRCIRCHVTVDDVEHGRVVVSPSGKAHFGEDWGVTRCGINAVGELWWWPL